jgi:chorismate dehydratase
MTLNIAAVAFLNTIPLIEWFVDHPSEDYALECDLPSRLALRLENGTSDVALLPVVELFRGRAAGIFLGAGIACRGAVDSVKFFYCGELGKIERVRSDRGSRTSIALLKVLLAENFGCRPLVEEFAPTAGMKPLEGEGHLVIGDRCFEYENALRVDSNEQTRVIDLGAAWFELTGLPFIFAAWCASQTLLERSQPEVLAKITLLLNRARDYGCARLAQIAEREAVLGRSEYAKQADSDKLLYYFERSLSYTIGESELSGVALFHQLCIKHGVVPDGPSPVIL